MAQKIELARRMAGQPDFHVMFCIQACIVFAQNGKHFGPAEFGGYLRTLGQPFPQLGPGYQQTIILVMWAGAGGGHSAALVTPERPVYLERQGLQRIIGQLIKYMVGIERTIVAPDARMVAALRGETVG